MSEQLIDTIDKLNSWYKKKFKDHQDEIVLGEGCINSPELVIVGEAPGKDEVIKKRPFVGKAGKNLDFFLNELGVDKSKAYITNAIKYRLKKISPRSGKFINRPATIEDISSNIVALHKEIHLLNPKLIVTLGNIPLRAVTNNWNVNIGNVHGSMSNVVIEGFVFLIYPLYHPASIIYNPKLKEVYLDDIRMLKNLLNYHSGVQQLLCTYKDNIM